MIVMLKVPIFYHSYRHRVRVNDVPYMSGVQNWKLLPIQ